MAVHLTPATPGGIWGTHLLANWCLSDALSQCFRQTSSRRCLLHQQLKLIPSTGPLQVKPILISEQALLHSACTRCNMQCNL